MTEVIVDTKRIPLLGGTPYLGFAVQAHAVLLEEHHADPEIAMVFNDTSAVVALTAGEPIGIITYFYSPPHKHLNVGIGFVLPEFRQRGVYRGMWDELVADARELGASKIYGSVKAGHEQMIRVANRLGRWVESHNVVYEL